MKKLTESQRLFASGQFADWFYLRTGMLATTKRGEKLRKKFLAGKPVRIEIRLQLKDVIP